MDVETLLSWVAKGGVLLGALLMFFRLRKELHQITDKKEEEIRADERLKVNQSRDIQELKRDVEELKNGRRCSHRTNPRAD